jgi:hypothetical protein
MNIETFLAITTITALILSVQIIGLIAYNVGMQQGKQKTDETISPVERLKRSIHALNSVGYSSQEIAVLVKTELRTNGNDEKP